MNYKSTLQTNNINLSEILTSINELPSENAGGNNIALQTKTVTPTKEIVVVSPDTGYNGLSSVTVEPIPEEYIVTTDATAIESDIVTGKTAYVNGVKITGTHTCSSGEGGTDTSDATAVAEDIVSGKTAYVAGGKVTGTMVIQNYYVGDTEPDASIGSDNDLYFVRG